MAIRRPLQTSNGKLDFGSRVKRWRRQAEEYRALADGSKSEHAQETYRSLAAECDQLAERFDETIASAERDGVPVLPREKPRL